METIILPAMTDADTDLEAQVRDAILALDALRPTRAEVTVSAANGQITLAGIVPSSMTAAEVERAARAVPGVTGVNNQVMDDGSLARHVAEALAKDARTREIAPGYHVACFIGHVTVVGYFSSEQAQAVTAVCQAVGGVHAVNVKTLA